MPVSRGKTILLLLRYAEDQPCIIQQGYKVWHVNEAAAALFGYDKAEMLGQDARMLAAPHEYTRLTQYNHARRHPEAGLDPPPTIYSLDIKKKCGAVVNTMIGVVLVEDGSDPKYILMVFSGTNLLSKEFAEVTDGLMRLINYNTTSVQSNTASVLQNTQEMLSVQGKLDTITDEVREGVSCMKDAMGEVRGQLAVLEDWRRQREECRKRTLTVIGLMLTVAGLVAGWWFQR